MELDKFLKKIPYLYHLSANSNLEFIIKSCKLYSTVEIIKMTNNPELKSILRNKRPNHLEVKIDGFNLLIRDQKPINKALSNCLTDGWSPGDFIFHLNKRVFLWPNLNRLEKHFNTYKSENPIILRFKTSELTQLNSNIEISKINSGATRTIPSYGGKPVPRGKNTFEKLIDYNSQPSKIAEVTFPNMCILPNRFEKGMSPIGPWDEIIFDHPPNKE